MESDSNFFFLLLKVFQQLEGKPELERLRLHRMMLTSERQKLIQALQENLKEDQVRNFNWKCLV